MAVTQSLSVTEVSGSVSTAGNTSKVRILWQSTQSGESWNGYTRTAKYYISINGGAETEYSVSYTLPQSSTKTIVDKTITVTHKSDGSGTVTVRTWMDTDISAGVIEKTDSVTLTTIPRASTITSASNRTLGKACSVRWTPLAKSFRYKLKFVLDEWSYTTGAIHPNTVSAYTYKGYTIPLSVANVLPKAKTGTITVTLYTYSDSGATTQIGSASSKAFTVTVPDNTSTKPSVTMTLAPLNSLGEPFSSLYIQGLTKAQATFTGSGKYSATISSYNLSVLGKSDSTSPYQSGYLTTAGTVTVTGKATDSRGYSNTVEQDITVISYGKPKILPASDESAIICARCDADGNLSESGTYLKIKARRSYYKITADGVQNNFCAIRYRYREESTNTFSSWKTILSKSTTSTNTIDSDPIANVVSSAETSYVVQVGVIDDIGYSAAVQFVIPTDFVTMDVPESHKGRRIGLLRYAQDTDEEGIDVGAPIHGGSVDNLTLGERITATSTAPIDLNNFKTSGNYYSPSEENSQYITNTPYTGGGFGLIVRHLQSENYIRQEMYYGRTNWQRHWNGEEWSDWVRYLMTPEDTSHAVDFVTEIGLHETDTGSWRYKKWKSGTYDLSGTFDVTPISGGTTGTAAVYYSEQIQIELPFAIETIQYTGSPAEQYCLFTNAALVSKGDADNNGIIGFRLLRFIDFSTEAVAVRLVARGRWK